MIAFSVFTSIFCCRVVALFSRGKQIGSTMAEVVSVANLREKCRNAITDNDARLFMETFYVAWDYLSSGNFVADDRSRRPIPPLFTCTTVSAIADDMVSNVFTLARWTLRGTGGLGSGGGFLLQGVRGVGKTTLLDGVYGVVQAVLPQYFLVAFIDYEIQEFQRPLAVLKQKAKETKVVSQEEADHTQDILSFLRLMQVKRRAVLFVADEVQRLFHRNVEFDDPNCRAVGDLVAIGKSTLGLGLLAGSTSRLQSLVFRQNAEDDPYALYPDLNNTVYAMTEIVPLRTRKQLQGVLRQLAIVAQEDKADVNAKLLETDIDAVCRATGGVGRLLPQLGQRPKPHYVDGFLAKFDEDTAFRAVMLRLFYENDGMMEGSAYNLWGPKRLTWSEMKETVGNRHGARAMACSWVDAALAFADTRTIGFFAGCHFDALREFLFDSNHPDRLLQLAVRITLGGWHGHGYASGRVEKYLQERYASSVEVDYEPRKLTFAQQGANTEGVFRLRVPSPVDDAAARSGVAAAECGDNARTLTELNGTLIDVCQVHGLDSFIVHAGDAPNTFRLEVLQVTTGEKSKTITMGGRRDKMRGNDRTMAGIIAKAQLAAEAFRNNVLALYKEAGADSPTLKVTSFTLITTKTLKPAARAEYVEKIHECQFGADIVEVCVVSGQNCYELMEQKVVSIIRHL